MLVCILVLIYCIRTKYIFVANLDAENGIDENALREATFNHPLQFILGTGEYSWQHECRVYVLGE